MKKSGFTALFIALALELTLAPARADEGMYPFDGIQNWPVDCMVEAGLKIAPEKLLELRQAIAKVAQGGSGSFVSNQGLMLTNHHVAYRCIAKLDGTDKYKGIMNDGFVAKSKADEIPCPGYDLLVVDEVRDVTALVSKKVAPTLTGHRRFETIRKAKDHLEEQCQAEDKGHICEVGTLDGGRFYHMMVYRRIRDVRLVYTPELDIGKFGGDVDNWMYPRHTGDYSFLRAYVDASGDEAPYHVDNVPLKTPLHLEVSAVGIKKGDVVTALGFPIRTKRNFPAKSAEFTRDIELAERLRIYKGIIDMIENLGKTDDVTARRYQSLKWGLNNGLKYSQKLLAGMRKWKVVEKRTKEEETIKAKFATEPRRAKQFQQLINSIDKAYKIYRDAFKRHLLLRGLVVANRTMATAYNIVRWTEERIKKDEDRKDKEYKTKNVYRIFDTSDRLDDEVTLAGERALIIYFLKESAKMPKSAQIQSAKKFVNWGQRELKKVKLEAKRAKMTYPEYYKQLTGQVPSDDPIATAVELALARTKLLAHSSARDERERALFQRRRLFYHDVGKARNFKDPLTDFARAVAREKQKIENGPYRAIEETFDTELRPKYAEMTEVPYPDANFQIRMTYGKVDDYRSTEDGKTHRYITDLAGLLAKDKGEPPFRVPKSLKKVATEDKGRFIDKVIGDVPIAFTSTLDATGGSSGSPVLDARGKLVGLLFDGTPESILSDWLFLPRSQRIISLDIRYPLFLAEKLHNAAHLLVEMGL